MPSRRQASWISPTIWRNSSRGSWSSSSLIVLLRKKSVFGLASDIGDEVLEQLGRGLVTAGGIFRHHALECLDHRHRDLGIELPNVRGFHFRVLLKAVGK